MRRIVPVFVLCLSLLTGCTPAPQPTPSLEGETVCPAPSSAVPESPTSLTRDEVPAWISCRIVDGAEEGELLLAELDRPLNDRELNHHDGKSVYRLPLAGETVTEMVPISVYLDGQPARFSDLKDGMNVEVSFNGVVMETFPAQLGEAYELHAYSIGTEQSPGGSFYDLCGLYLQVLSDLWSTDHGLNSDISLAGLDLSKAPGGLLESEKTALCWRFGEKHGVEVIQGTYEELAEEGRFVSLSDDPEHPLYHWEDGCLFSITAAQGHEEETDSLPVLFFDAQKWRSPLGAYFFEDCSVVWPERGTWSGYQVGNQAIS